MEEEGFLRKNFGAALKAADLFRCWVGCKMSMTLYYVTTAGSFITAERPDIVGADVEKILRDAENAI